MSPADERELMAYTSERLALGMTVGLQLATEAPPSVPLQITRFV